MPSNQPPRFEDLTETTGIPLSPEGARMMFTRYSVAQLLSRGRRVLEIGCGSGQGLGMLAQDAASVVGTDFSMPLLLKAREHYRSRVPLVRLSADALPFRPDSFDLILCFEASYYVPNMEQALDEISSSLSKDGTILFVNANPERRDFIPSPHSVRYHSADEFRASLSARGFKVSVMGAFPIAQSETGLVSRFFGGALSLARRTLDLLGLVPKTLRGRARLKRLLYGKLPTVPSELTAGFSEIAQRTSLSAGPQRDYKVIYIQAGRGQY
jgi:SAM-dependent methyltransferase